MAKTPEAEDWLRALVALFGAGIAGGSAGSIISGLGGSFGGGGGVSTAGTGDKVRSIGHNFNYDLNYIPGPAQENRMLMQNVANEAILRQTPEEHMRALTKYVRPGMTPAEQKVALQRGKEYEESLLSWWDDDRPRRNFTPSSSAVSGIRITPDNRIQIRFGRGGKWYSYRGGATPNQAAIELKKLIGTNGQSIGRALCRKSKNFGQWARDHYLGGY